MIQVLNQAKTGQIRSFKPWGQTEKVEFRVSYLADRMNELDIQKEHRISPKLGY